MNPKLTYYLLQRISISLQCSNAASIIVMIVAGGDYDDKMKPEGGGGRAGAEAEGRNVGPTDDPRGLHLQC